MSGSSQDEYGGLFSYWKTRIPIAFVLILGTGISLVMALYIRNLEYREMVSDFHSDANVCATAFTNEINKQLTVLESLRSVYVAAGGTEQKTFRGFAEPYMEGLQGVQAVEWIPRVPHSDRARFEATMQSQGAAGFRITERNADGDVVAAAVRSEYFPVSSMAPDADASKVLGFDLASETTRRLALQKARSTGETTATARINLVQETENEFGLLVYLPVYSPSAAPRSQRERSEHLQGFIVGVFRVPDLVDQAISYLLPSGVGYALIDESASAAEKMLYHKNWRSESSAGDSFEASAARLQRIKHGVRIEVAGRTWNFTFMPTSAYAAAKVTLTPLYVLIIGLLVTALLAAYLNANLNRVVGLARANVELEHEIAQRQLAEHERGEFESQVQYAQKLESLGVLAGGIAHDFNNLLMGMLGMAEVGRHELPEDSAAGMHFEDIEKSARRAAELCNQLLAYSGKGRFVIEAVDVSDVVKEMAHLLRVSIAKNVAIDFNFYEQPLPVMADVSQLRQVVMNLITNASDAIGAEPGTVWLETGVRHCTRDDFASSFTETDLPEGEYIYFKVRDSGSGMDRDTQSKIFDPFFTTKTTGRGLGLAATLGIVRGHKGALLLDSAPDSGTTITVFLPATEQSIMVTDADESSHEDKTGAGTILVIDDEELVRRASKLMLESGGFSVITAESGGEGIELYRERRDDICAVLVDMTMAHVNGEQTMIEIRQIDKDVPVILSSGYTESDIAEEFSDKGFSGFLHKPYGLEELLNTLQGALDRRTSSAVGTVDTSD